MSKVKDYRLLKFEPIVTTGKPGELIDLDINKIALENDLHFNISKCSYINELNSEKPRGNHSNYNATEILICLAGSFDINLNNGKTTYCFKLTKNQGIYINSNIWIEFFNFKDCIILAFVNIIDTDKKSCYDFNDYLLQNK